MKLSFWVWFKMTKALNTFVGSDHPSRIFALWVIVALSEKTNISKINVEIWNPNWIAHLKLNSKTFEIINQFRNIQTKLNTNILCAVSNTFQMLGNYCGLKNNSVRFEFIFASGCSFNKIKYPLFSALSSPWHFFYCWHFDSTSFELREMFLLIF